MIILHHAAMSSCSQKVRFVLEEKALAWEAVNVDLHNSENYSDEFKKLNPKAIIPVLMDDSDLIIESNNICLYLDEKYPQHPLMPDNAKGRSDVRTLLQLVDEQVHNDSSVLTYAIAFRARLASTYDTDEKLKLYLAKVPDAGRRYLKQQLITKGVDSVEFKIAVTRLDAMIQSLSERLQDTPYLAGHQLSIADIAYSPYITRLDHLGMSYLWKERPAIAEWYERLKQTKGYQNGISAYFIQGVIDNLMQSGSVAEQQVHAVLETLNNID